MVHAHSTPLRPAIHSHKTLVQTKCSAKSNRLSMVELKHYELGHSIINDDLCTNCIVVLVGSSHGHHIGLPVPIASGHPSSRAYRNGHPFALSTTMHSSPPFTENSSSSSLVDATPTSTFHHTPSPASDTSAGAHQATLNPNKSFDGPPYLGTIANHLRGKGPSTSTSNSSNSTAPMMRLSQFKPVTNDDLILRASSDMSPGTLMACSSFTGPSKTTQNNGRAYNHAHQPTYESIDPLGYDRYL